MARLVLASTSPYRRELLARLHVQFTTRAHGVDEAELKQQFLGSVSASDGVEAPLTASQGKALAALLATQKAAGAATQKPDEWVLGSDQLAILEGRVLGKPGSREAARSQLQALAGRTHWLLTAAVLRSPGGAVDTHVDVHEMTMRHLSEGEIGRYVEIDSPTDCAGAYKIEASGIALFDKVKGEDFSAIVGLPLLAVTRMLLSHGFAVPGPAQEPRADR